MKKPTLEERALGFMEPFLEAERGDFRRVADMIERGEDLPASTRKLVADQLRGEGIAPSRRTRQQQRTDFKIYCQVYDHIETGMSKFAAIQKVAAELKMSEETIKTYMRRLKDENSN